MEFNTGVVVESNCIGLDNNFTQTDIKNEFGLWNAPLEVAMNLGGAITKEALRNMDLRFDKKHITVDVKTHLLQPGMYPAIPGWHTDGVPRGGSMSPARGNPDIKMQLNQKSPRYHLMVLGADCPTMFLKNRGIELFTDFNNPKDLYKGVTQQVKNFLETSEAETFEITPGVIYEWDWWELHTAQAARSSGWRYLIRVTESDYLEPQTDLNEIFRRQQQVFVPSTEFGW